MRKWLIILLCVCLFCFVACGETGTEKPSASATESEWQESVESEESDEASAEESDAQSEKEETTTTEDEEESTVTDKKTTTEATDEVSETAKKITTTKKRTTTKRTTKKTTAKTTEASTTETIEKTTETTTTTAALGVPLEEFAVKKQTLVGEEGKNNWIYRLGEDGITVHEAVIDAGLGGEPLEIVQLTDAHLGWNYVARQRYQKLLRYGGQYDYIVATGDMIESTWRDLLAFFQTSLSPYPKVMACLGNHELVGKSETVGISDDFTERCAVIQEYWPNDVLYSSDVLDNRVMLIQLDNSQNKFHDSQVEKFKKDLSKAREKGYAVLVFYHIPLRTENKQDRAVEALLPKDPEVNNTYNFYTSQLRGGSASATGKIHDLIINNGDVIKGTFCGHFHESIYTEFAAKTPDGQDVFIPQYIGHAANLDGGHVRKITIK